jgi:glycosyltransferase involved in cell wall biosynthesis
LSSTAKLKVCQLSSLHFALDTRIFYKYATSLSKDYDVIVVGLHPQKEVINGVMIIPFKEYHNRTIRLFTSWLLMFFVAIKQKAKIYHIHDPELLPCALLLKILGKKVIIDVHENIAEDIFDKEWIRFKKTTYRIFNFLERSICKNLPIVLAEDSYLKRYQNIAKDITIIHNYVEPEFFSPFVSENRNPLKLFYMGIILESRCVHEIMSAMKILHDKGIKVHFYCVGKIYKRIALYIKSHPNYEQLIDYLHFPDRQTLEDGYAYSKNCGIGICLIRPMKNSVDSKPTKLFEYMACGLPILTSNFLLYKNLVEDTETGITVDPMNPSAIAEAIEILIKDQKTRLKMSYNGQIAAKLKFNWALEKQKLEALYHRILIK